MRLSFLLCCCALLTAADEPLSVSASAMTVEMRVSPGWIARGVFTLHDPHLSGGATVAALKQALIAHGYKIDGSQLLAARADRSAQMSLTWSTPPFQTGATHPVLRAVTYAEGIETVEFNALPALFSGLSATTTIRVPGWIETVQGASLLPRAVSQVRCTDTDGVRVHYVPVREHYVLESLPSLIVVVGGLLGVVGFLIYLRRSMAKRPTSA